MQSMNNDFLNSAQKASISDIKKAANMKHRYPRYLNMKSINEFFEFEKKSSYFDNFFKLTDEEYNNRMENELQKSKSNFIGNHLDFIDRSIDVKDNLEFCKSEPEREIFSMENQISKSIDNQCKKDLKWNLELDNLSKSIDNQCKKSINNSKKNKIQ